MSRMSLQEAINEISNTYMKVFKYLGRYYGQTTKFSAVYLGTGYDVVRYAKTHILPADCDSFPPMLTLDELGFVSVPKLKTEEEHIVAENKRFVENRLFQCFADIEKMKEEDPDWRAKLCRSDRTNKFEAMYS